ncbi:DUF1156 domain-containing protein [Bifidobacterium scaligerum]|uniref:DUF1156 domain-containing protein n=1 Tax=Bifidobacterium scaligerum TaxID=2052656 RepID=A0A2M9HQG4_9BIFI|nr:DUF1156 domain-containing protein [Bifidobacterium scaligerum]PJM79043.1 hypothetical protein CUU80_06830 [Bifidobacterium scaligerum]
MTDTPRRKKLIETGIPLKKINEESAREKSLRHGLPSTLHLYWARRPLATTRSILFAQLVDDPASHPEKFPTVEEQDEERSRLHRLMERLARWENINDAELYREANRLIEESSGKVAVLDPFAGGGSIPLEAQRLGLESHASDLNPLPVILNKALIDFPARFCGQASVNPEAKISSVNRAEGMADDIRYYGKMLRDKAFDKVGHLYPKVKDENGEERTVIAWIWARTVTNPNPANPVQVPLVRSWWLSKKKGHEAWIKPVIEDGTIRYEVQHNADGPTGDAEGTVSAKGAISIIDETPIDLKYIRNEGKHGRLGNVLIAVVAEGDRGRLYISPDSQQSDAADVPKPDDIPFELLPDKALGFRVQAYGFKMWSDLFTNRQLTVLTTLADTVSDVRGQVLKDALAKGLPQGEPLDAGGTGAQAYADAVSVYLALAVSRQTDRCSSIASWQNIGEKIRNVFARQAISMTWDYAEANPFSSKSGNFLGQVNWVMEAIQNVPSRPQGEAHQADAAARDYVNVVVSTDPPYYDNIGYSDLSDYFYVWLRRMLRKVLPSTVLTALTPKTQELVANPYRHNGRDGAAEFFVDGFNHVFAHIRETANTEMPMTVYYAYKQQDEKSGTSTGWYALLDGLIKAGWEITATLPVHSERQGRTRQINSNALASSIVLACRPRPEDAPSVTMRIFNSVLRSELTEELRTLMTSGIDPVDLSQAAIGPGISVYSRYSRIREADGSDMPVQKALEIINRTVDEVMGDADSDYDPDTRFAVKWYQSYGWNQENTGMADQLARSCGTSPDTLVRGGMFEAAGGKSRLLTPAEMADEYWHPLQDDHVSLWEACIRMAGILDAKGVDKVAPVMAEAGELLPLDYIRALGFRMYHEAEKRKDTEGAIRFNNLVSMWDDLSVKASTENVARPAVQGELDVA